MQDDVVAISPLVKKKPTTKKLTRKKQLHLMHRKVYDLEGILTKAKRHFTTLLPWEDIAQALKDDTLEQVRDNRNLKQQVGELNHLYEILYAWIQSMNPQESIPNAFQETWRHSQLMKGDEESRRVAQNWIIQQAYHNSEQALAALTFPSMDQTCIEVDVVVCPLERLLRINTMTQCVLPYSLDKVSDALWVAEKRFTRYKSTGELPCRNELYELLDGNLRYRREIDSTPATLDIQKNCLHGQVRDIDRTTIIFRTIVHDEAYPLDDTSAWTLDIKEWMVADRLDGYMTRLRTFYTMNHPSTSNGYVSIEEFASELGMSMEGDVLQRVKEMIQISHYRQRELFYEHLYKVLNLLDDEFSK